LNKQVTKLIAADLNLVIQGWGFSINLKNEKYGHV
jgi:hypothetical protein